MPENACRESWNEAYEEKLKNRPENSLIRTIKSTLKNYIDGKITGPVFFKWLMEYMISINKYHTSETNDATEYIVSIELLWYDMEHKKKFHLAEILEGKHCSFYTKEE